VPVSVASTRSCRPPRRLCAVDPERLAFQGRAGQYIKCTRGLSRHQIPWSTDLDHPHSVGVSSLRCAMVSVYTVRRQIFQEIENIQGPQIEQDRIVLSSSLILRILYRKNHVENLKWIGIIIYRANVNTHLLSTCHAWPSKCWMALPSCRSLRAQSSCMSMESCI
jgi:hypothetical protein